MQISEIIRCLEELAPRSYQESYDNAGLLTGRPEWELSGILLTLDSTEEVVDEAIAQHCNLIVAHHPIIFRGLKSLTGRNYVERTVIKALKNDVALYAAHTNLDNVYQGVNNMIAERLGLQQRRILSPLRNQLKKLYTFVPQAHAGALRDALFSAGAGYIGGYSECSFNTEGAGTYKAGENTQPFTGSIGERHTEAETRIEVIFPAYLENKVVRSLLQHHPYEEVAYDIVSLDNEFAAVGAGMVGELTAAMDETAFLHFLKDRMHTDCIRYTRLLDRPVKRVAICGGAGSFLLPAAIRAGADVFVSADFKYHEFFDADNQILIADIGHYESEQFTIDLFYHVLSEKFPNFAPLKSQIRTNPIKYLH